MIALENVSESMVIWGGLEFAAHEKRVIDSSDLQAIQNDDALAIALFQDRAIVYVMGELVGSGRSGYVAMMRYESVIPA